MKQRANRRRRGFTLIEVSVAMGLFGLIMLGVVAMATTSFMGTQASKLRLRATHLANNMLENLNSSLLVDAEDIDEYDEVRTDQINSFPPDDTLCTPWKQAIESQLGAGARGEILVVNITDAVNQPLTGKKRITVTVYWPYRKGGENQANVVGVR